MRPLGLNNTDDKALAATLASALARAISKAASPVQQGFVQGRRFTDNIVEIDWSARRALELPRSGDWSSSRILSPLVALFDVRAAHTVRECGIPTGLQNALLCMYENVSTMTLCGGEWNHQFYTARRPARVPL